MEDKIAAAGGRIVEPEQKYNILALFGKAGSGKDTIRNKLLELYPDRYRRLVSYTTRPPRLGEVEGHTYHFVDPNTFAAKVINFSMLEATCFNVVGDNWFYGTSIDDLTLDKINVGVFNPTAIEALVQDNRLKVLPIYISCVDKVRLLRQLEREKNPNCSEICRRFLADEGDFPGYFSFYYETIFNSEPISSSLAIDAINEYVWNYFGQDN